MLMGCKFHALDDALNKIVLDHVGSHIHGERKAEVVGAPVALHHDTVKTEKHPAVVGARVQPGLEIAKGL
jgi:hypothetical protein